MRGTPRDLYGLLVTGDLGAAEIEGDAEVVERLVVALAPGIPVAP